MSQTPLTAFSSTFQSILDASLKEYQKKTKKDLLTYPLMAQLQQCDSPASLQAISEEIVYSLTSVAIVPQSPCSDCLNTEPTQGTRLFAESQAPLIDIFQLINSFFGRFESYIRQPMTEMMADIIVRIMVEVLHIFVLVTKDIKRGRASESIPDDPFPAVDRDSETYFMNLLGRRDITDALRRLERLIQEEARMLSVQVLNATHVRNIEETVRDKVKDVNDEDNVVSEGTFSKLATHKCCC